jgi:hypothetical protein
MPPWERYNPNAAPDPLGPWTKFATTVAAPETKWREPGMIVPVQFSEDHQWRWAMPQMVTETIKAIEAPGKALKGEYGMEIDPETGRPTTITNEMIGDTMGLAGLGLAPLNTGARAGAMVGKGVIKPAASSLVRKELDAAGIPLGEVGPRLSTIGPDAMVMDLTPGLRARAAAVATMPGSGQKTVVDALSARRAGSNARIQGDVDAALGPAPIPSRLAAENALSKQTLGPEYQALFRERARAVDTSPIALDLDSMAVNLRGDAQKRAQQIRSMLDVVGTEELDPNPETLFQVRQAIDGILATEQNPQAVGTMKYIRAQVDDMLANAVPGIKDIDAQYAELARQGDAVQTGQRLLDTGREAPRPVEVEDLMTSGALPQGTQIGPSAVPLRLSQGARADIDRIIGTNIRDINAMKKIVAGEGNWNRDRLASVFGQEKADRLLQILEREAAYNASEEMALQGSRTQVLKAAQEDIAGKGPRANPARSAANFQFGDAIAGGADRALGWLYSAKRGATNNSLADVLTARPDNLQTLAAIAQPGVGPVAQQSHLALLRAHAQQPR